MVGANVFKRGYSSLSVRTAFQFLIVALCFATAEPTTLSLGVGASVCFLGEAFRLWAAGYGYKLGAMSGRGPYRFMRHPYFLGSTLLFLGFTIAGRDPYLFVFAATGLAFIYRRDMRVDEGQMALRLGPDYSLFRDQVPAFLPQMLPVSFGPAERGQPRGFSFRFAVFTGKHRELDALLLSALAFGLLALSLRLADRWVFHLASIGIVALYLVLRILYYSFYKKTGRRS